MGVGLAGSMSQDEWDEGWAVAVSLRGTYWSAAGGRAVGPGLPPPLAPVSLLMAWWFTSCAEAGALLPPSVLLCVGSEVTDQSWGCGCRNALGCGHWLCLERCVHGRGEGSGVGILWLSCPVPGLGGRSGMWHRGSGLCLCRCGGLQWERVEWCWEESWGGAPALAPGQFCALPGDPPGFVCW